ncbi:MAG: septum formation protein Maf [Bacteroidales bacterium]|nr:septum formation protein Maf [Bacteroidales bacterium]
MLKNFEKFNIILASKSPRRQELLRELGLKFEVAEKDYDETYPDYLRAEEIALYLASAKAETFTNRINANDIVITADTVVWCNNTILNKPSSREDARKILRAISGNTHEVITGVCLFSVSKKKTFHSSTKVTFEPLDESEIDYYVDNYKPYDKAGAYGIQEWIGVAACSKIEGSYFNVVGLPAHQLYKELRDFIEG